MRTFFQLTAMALTALLLIACSSGTVKRVSPPGASVQQVSVQTDGQWVIQLRLQNFSSMAMTFSTTDLSLVSGNTAAAELRATSALTIGPESADNLTLTVLPTPEARQLVAGILADGRSLPYQLKGTLEAAPSERRARQWPIDFRSTLHPAPGLPGVLR